MATDTRQHLLPTLTRWTLLLAAAETLGMAAAAAAAKTSQALVGEPSTGAGVLAALSLVVAGGLVEGAALGSAQAVGLGGWLPSLRRSTWVLVTVLVAGGGWAVASAPSVLAATDEGQAGPPLGLVLLGGAALGAVMGAVLGAAQALVLHSHVSHPWWWVTANVLGWAPAMVVIMLGATTPGADWSVARVVGLGALTGAVAGAVLAAVTWRFLPRLKG